MPSVVTAVPAAESSRAVAHFESALGFETDCWDVHHALSEGPDFVLIDVRSPELFARGHVPQAINIPHGKLLQSRLDRFAPGTTFVVYCAGPHCNGGHRGAIRLARLGRPVKLMIGGMSGWREEGFAIETGPGSVAAG